MRLVSLKLKYHKRLNYKERTNSAVIKAEEAGDNEEKERGRMATDHRELSSQRLKFQPVL